jgi:hypothetical protein
MPGQDVRATFYFELTLFYYFFINPAILGCLFFYINAVYPTAFFLIGFRSMNVGGWLNSSDVKYRRSMKSEYH